MVLHYIAISQVLLAIWNIFIQLLCLFRYLLPSWPDHHWQMMSIGEGQNVERPLNLFSPQQAIRVPHPLLSPPLSRPRVALNTTWGQQLMWSRFLSHLTLCCKLLHCKLEVIARLNRRTTSAKSRDEILSPLNLTASTSWLHIETVFQKNLWTESMIKGQRWWSPAFTGNKSDLLPSSQYTVYNDKTLYNNGPDVSYS